jgi:hypothetical protein
VKPGAQRLDVSVLLRQRQARTPSPLASANSAMWLPTNPVIPVINTRMKRVSFRAMMSKRIGLRRVSGHQNACEATDD